MGQGDTDCFVHITVFHTEKEVQKIKLDPGSAIDYANIASNYRELGQIDILRAGDLELDTGALKAKVAGEPVELTPTEFQLLATLVRQPGRIFRREQLLQAIHGVVFDGYDRSVDSHVKNLRRKIEEDPRQPRYIETVYGVGYRMRTDNA